MCLDSVIEPVGKLSAAIRASSREDRIITQELADSVSTLRLAPWGLGRARGVAPRLRRGQACHRLGFARRVHFGLISYASADASTDASYVSARLPHVGGRSETHRCISDAPADASADASTRL